MMMTEAGQVFHLWNGIFPSFFPQGLLIYIEFNFEGLKAKQGEVVVKIEKEETEILESRRALIKQTKGKEGPLEINSLF